MRALAAWAMMVLISASAAAQKSATLSEVEEDRVRETQDPGQRIIVYLDYEEARLARIEQFRNAPRDPRYDSGAYLDKLFGEYISLNDEMKNWIQDQYDNHGDMRAGLRALLERGPRQLEQLRNIKEHPDPYAAAYAASLNDAVEDVTDAIDGATKALGDQEKLFAQMKHDEKAEARATKERTKEEKKRTKAEKKVRKREHRKGVPGETEEN